MKKILMGLMILTGAATILAVAVLPWTSLTWISFELPGLNPAGFVAQTDVVWSTLVVVAVGFAISLVMGFFALKKRKN